MSAKKAASKRREQDPGEVADRRRRILDAALSAFMKSGYARTSTLEIATRAGVSKRALYELFESKQEILAVCISARARRLEVLPELSSPRDREGLAQVLTAVGAQLMREVSDPTVIAVFRLAIAEAINAPEVAWALNSIGREASRTTLREVMTRAQSSGLVGGNPAEMAEDFAGLLWRNLMVSLLLRVAERPTEQEVEQRASAAAAAFLRLYPEPK